MEIPKKPLSRKPFMLMLRDDAGEIEEVKLDPDLVNSNNALIVLDEYNDTCWVWVGKNVSMPTRMHTLRIARSTQKSGHKVGVTTIGMATSRLVEMLEKDASDPEVAANIEEFKRVINRPWKFEDEVLAYDESLAGEYEVAPVKVRESATESAPAAAPERPAVEKRAEPRRPAPAPPKKERATPSPQPAISTALSPGELKAAHLLYAAVKNGDLIYAERYERGGKSGLRIEVPGAMILEVDIEKDRLNIRPPHFGDSDQAKAIKAAFEELTKSL